MLRPFARMFVVGTLAAAATLGAACSYVGGSAAPTGVEKPDLTVAAVPSLDSAGLYIAQQRGLFAAEGLHVTIVPAISSSTVIAAQLAGKYDATLGAYPGYILADALHKADLRILAAASNMAPGGFEVMVPAGSPIHRVVDLRGKRVGVNALNNIATLVIASLLSDNGLTPADVTFVPVPFPKMAAALKAHQVDSAWLVEPYITAAEETVGATALADVDQGATQGLPVAGYSVTQSWLDRYPKTAAAFRRALLEAQGIANADLGAVQNGLAAYAGVPRAMAQLAAIPAYPLRPDVRLLQRVADLMEQYGMTTEIFNVSSIIRG
jgi:NitT/TauT family transport system substrate-binding protein